MTKFEELCQAYKEARDKYIKYRDESVKFTGVFVSQLI